MRRGEVVELDLEHFDARGNRVSVLRKGKRERKWLSLDPLVTARLQAWVALRGKEPGPLFLQLGKGGRVLASRRLSGDGVHKILETMGAKLGGIIRPHGLRHAAITAALDETNGNVRAAREFSGHASIEVLMRYDDNRKDVGGEVASKVIRSLAQVAWGCKSTHRRRSRRLKWGGPSRSDREGLGVHPRSPQLLPRTYAFEGSRKPSMSTPRGCLKSMTTAFKRLARNGDVDGLRAYLRSDAFLTAFTGLDPQGRQSAMRCYATAGPCVRRGALLVGQAQTHPCQARAEDQLG